MASLGTSRSSGRSGAKHSYTSTRKAKYYSASKVAAEFTYLRHPLNDSEMGFKQSIWTPVYGDNTACIEWGNKFIVEVNVPSTLISTSTLSMKLSSSDSFLVKVDTSNQLADIFTKAMPPLIHA